jgi:short-subunit dehydrogenase
MRLLVLGGTSAIAQSAARNFAADRADILLVGRNQAGLDSVRGDLLVRGARSVTTLVADLGDVQGHPGLIERAIKELGGLDAVLIAHGSLPDPKLAHRSVEVALREFQVNAVSYVSLLTLLANELESRRAGCIAVISSVAGERGRGSNYLYAAAKAAVTAFSGGLRARLHASGVRVVTIKPGLIDTPMTASFKKGPLFVGPEVVGRRIYEAMLKGEDVVYTPGFWAPIMLAIRLIPERIFKRLPL